MGWFAWIPVLNWVLMLQVANKPMWWVALLMFVPCANIIICIMLWIAYLEEIGQSPAWAWALLFPFLLLIPLYRAAKD